MSYTLPTIFHWSPASRYYDIARNGLQVFSESVVSSKGSRWPYICFGFDPSSAWAISGEMAMDRDREETEDKWDLWELTQYPESAEIHVNAAYGPELKEVRLMTSVPPHMLWHAGRKGEQEIGLDQDFKPLTEDSFGLGDTEMIECPDQETIDTLLTIIDNDHLLDAASPDAIKKAAQRIISLIPDPRQPQ